MTLLRKDVCLHLKKYILGQCLSLLSICNLKVRASDAFSVFTGDLNAATGKVAKIFSVNADLCLRLFHNVPLFAVLETDALYSDLCFGTFLVYLDLLDG